MANPNIIATDEDGNELTDVQIEVNGIVPGSGSSDDGGGDGTTDTRTDVSDNGSEVASDAENIDFRDGLDAESDGSGGAEVTANVGTDEIQSDAVTESEISENAVTDAELVQAAFVVEHPDRPPIAALEDGESIEMPIRVPDGATLEVYRWGAFDVADGSAPSGLTVELLDGGDTVQSSASTANDQDKTSSIASHENTSGSASIYKLRALNGTGGSLGMEGDSSPGVGCVFGYRVI